MTEINTSLISAFQHSFSPSPLSSASSSPTSTLSTYSRRHNSCNDNLSFDYSVQPLIPLETEKSLNNDSHDFIYRRNSNTIEYRRPKKEIASWKKSFSELSEKLGEICGSSSSICLESTPKSKSCLSSQSLSSSPMNHFKLKDKLKVVKINDSFDEILNKKNSNSTELVRKPQMKRAESLFEAVPFYKNIAVRHLETNLRLQNQLFQITKKSNTSGKLGIDTFDDLNDASISFTDYQLSSLQSQKINFQEQILLPSLEDFKVELVDGNLIVVKNSCNSGHIILEAKIEKPINNNCICFMDNSKNLFLNCYLSSIVSLNTGQGTNSFIPVVTQNSNSKREVLGTVAKLTKTCQMRLGSKSMYFLLLEHQHTSGCSIWCELPQESFFEEYKIEGAAGGDDILLNVQPDQLLKCLRSSHNVMSLKIKLTKRATPCLTFLLEQPTLQGMARRVTHDAPVSLVDLRLWQSMLEPDLPPFQVSIYLPPLKVLGNVLERMKNLSNMVTISADGTNGRMQVQVEKELVSVTTHFDNITYPTWSTPLLRSIINL